MSHGDKPVNEEAESINLCTSNLQKKGIWSKQDCDEGKTSFQHEVECMIKICPQIDLLSIRGRSFYFEISCWQFLKILRKQSPLILVEKPFQV